MKSIKDQRVLITGAARGIGAEVARQLVEKGARVALVGLEPDLLSELAQNLGSENIWFECDVTDFQALEHCVKKVIGVFGGLDVVVANAGIACTGTVAISPVEVMSKIVEVNLIGTINTVSACLPAMIESRGYLLLVGSMISHVSMPGSAAYTASKVAVESFAKTLRLEVAHKGVDVGIIKPGWTDTDLVQDQMKGLNSFKGLFEILPWPFYIVTSVEKCGKEFVNAISRRRRSQCVPYFVAFVGPKSWINKIWEVIFGLAAHRLIPESEQEVKDLGRFFGPNSMGAKLIEKSRGKSGES